MPELTIRDLEVISLGTMKQEISFPDPAGELIVTTRLFCFRWQGQLFAATFKN
jgi:hypothetical protein